MKVFASISVTVLTVMSLTSFAIAESWVFSMADTVYVSGKEIHFSDLSQTELPASVAGICMGGNGAPGSSQQISRKRILRHLVTAGKASGVSFRGPSDCVVVRIGQSLDPHSLRPKIRRALQPFIPVGHPEAPATWFELELPDHLGASEGGEFTVRLANPVNFEPGRNHVSIELNGESENINFPVTVVLHQFRETACAKMKIKRGDSLEPHLFNWQWVDLAVKKQKSDFYGRESLFGVSSARTIKAGRYLHQCDLKATPVVLSGERVELLVERGTVSVSVQATARQEGSIGQTIPVRNELTKRLVNARVVAPGIVKWRN